MNNFIQLCQRQKISRLFLLLIAASVLLIALSTAALYQSNLFTQEVAPADDATTLIVNREVLARRGRNPVAVISPSMLTGYAAFGADFEGNQSYHPRNRRQIVSYEWSVSGGAWKVSETATRVTYIFPSAGTYTVSLKVTDDRGRTGTTSVQVTALPKTRPPFFP